MKPKDGIFLKQCGNNKGERETDIDKEREEERENIKYIRTHIPDPTVFQRSFPKKFIQLRY